MVNENVFLLHSVITGVFITFVYDLLRIFRRVVPHAGFMVSLEDLAFWIYCGTEVFLLMYRESNGTLRWFAVLGALGGMLFYRKAVSPLLVKHVALLLGKLLKILGKILQWLFRPFCFVGRKTGNAVHKIGGRTKKRLKKTGRFLKLRLTFFLKVFRINLKD